MDSIPQKCCTQCRQEKPATSDFFSPNYGKLRPQCKQCDAKRAHDAWIAKHPRDIIPEGHRRCTSCGNIFPLTSAFFYVHKAHKDGWDTLCKTCAKEKTRVVRERYRANNAKGDTTRSEEKRCRVCERSLPATADFFHRSKTQKDGLYTDCKACVNKRMKEYYSDPEVHKRCLASSKVHGRTYSRTERGRATIRASDARRRSRKKAIAGVHTPRQIQDLLERQKHKCYYCSKKFEKREGKYLYHVDHTFPINRVVGTDIPANDISYLVMACPHCNHSKGDKFPHEWPEGGRLL